MSRQAVTRGLSPSRAVLQNGAVILAQEIGGVPTVAVNATFYAGSIYDPNELPGVAYLTRHTLDRGTEFRTAGEVAELLDDRGVSLRVWVSRHTFSLSCVCLAEDFVRVLDLIAEIARFPAFPPAQIDKGRLEAITSVREDQDDPSHVAGDLLLEALYGADHPYGRSVKGTADSLGRIRREDLFAFHSRCIVPSALRLAVAGELPEGRMLSAASAAFDDWRAPAWEDVPVPPPPCRTARAVRVRHMPGKSQADVAYGFTAIRRTDPRYYAYTIMNNILGQFGLGGRLADNIRERQGMAYYAYSTLDALWGEGPLVIRAGVDPHNVQRTIDAIDTEVRLLRAEGPTVDEMEQTRESLIGSIPRLLENNEAIAEFLLNAEQFGLGLDYDRRLPEFFGRVTFDEVREAAAEVLDPDRAAIGVAGPLS